MIPCNTLGNMDKKFSSRLAGLAIKEVGGVWVNPLKKENL